MSFAARAVRARVASACDLPSADGGVARRAHRHIDSDRSQPHINRRGNDNANRSDGAQRSRRRRVCVPSPRRLPLLRAVGPEPCLPPRVRSRRQRRSTTHGAQQPARQPSARRSAARARRGPVDGAREHRGRACVRSRAPRALQVPTEGRGAEGGRRRLGRRRPRQQPMGEHPDVDHGGRVGRVEVLSVLRLRWRLAPSPARAAARRHEVDAD